MVSVHRNLLFLWAIQGLVRCYVAYPEEIPVTLGKSVTLNCTLNCTKGFARGCWKRKRHSPCLGKESNCTVFHRITNVTREDVNTPFFCFTRYTDDPRLEENVQLIVSLSLQVETTASNVTLEPKVTPGKDQTRADLTGIKVLATVTVVVAVVLAALAAHLCMKRNRQSGNGKEALHPMSVLPSVPRHGAPSPVPGSSSTHCERVIVQVPTSDNGSDDTEVPYADIMIAVRGVSTPELSQVCYLNPGDRKECMLDESKYVLSASRSADRLHVHQPREVSRKMSTNSEYAVITYA